MRVKFAGFAVAAVGLLASQSAFGADLPVKAPLVAPVASSWTGLYGGLNGGYGWGDTDYSIAPDSQAAAFYIVTHKVTGSSVDVHGGVAGLQLGYNWQVSPKWVTGIEADIDWSNLKGASSTFVTSLPGDTLNHQFENKLNWLGTVRGRAGFLVNENMLAFATGGLAYGQTSASQSTFNLTTTTAYFQGVFPDGSTFFCNFGICSNGSGSRTSVGWTIGGGLEYAVSQKITLKAEYLYVDLGDQTIHPQSQSFGGSTPTSIAVTYHNVYNIVRAGINLRF